MAGLVLIGDWKKFESRLDARARARVLRASDMGTRRAALYLTGQVRKEIQSGSFKPDSPMTIALKGSTKPLIDKGRLYQSITNQRVRRAVYFIGINMQNQAYNIGKVLHDGVTIKVTARMRRMFTLLWYVTKRAVERTAKRPGGAQKPASPGSRRSGPLTVPAKGEGQSRSKPQRSRTRAKRRDPLAFLKSPRARELARRAIRRRVVIFPIAKGTTAIRIPARPFIRNVIKRRSVVAQCRKIWEQAITAALTGRAA